MKAIESFNMEDSFGLISLEEAEKINGGVVNINSNLVCIGKANVPVLAGVIAVPDFKKFELQKDSVLNNEAAFKEAKDSINSVLSTKLN